jgi:uncharacterized membrane protein
MMALRLLSVGGLLLSGYLSFAYSGPGKYLVGCGGDSGCANALGSKWSQWFLVPVTAFSLLLYAALLFLTFKPRRTPLLAIATSLAGAALWFGSVQAFILKSFCPWCLSAHAIGFACATVIFLKLRRPAGATAPSPVAKAKQKKSAEGLRQPLMPGVLAGLAGVAVLILGQVFGPAPETHLETDIVLEKDATTPASAPGKPETGPVHTRGQGRRATFLRNKEYNVSALPHLGNPDAPHVVVKYFDYACDACRDLHADLDAFMAKHPGKFCIVLLPCPIERACNPHMPSHLNDHAHACELARVALACWRTDPASFPAVHHALFARPVMDTAKALEAVKPLTKKPLTAEALKDPWIAELLAADSEDYKRINITNTGEPNYLMPKLLVGGTRMLHGVTKSREVLFQALEYEFKIAAP